MTEDILCPICGSKALLHDVVDFNKSCTESNGFFLELSGIAVYYALCDNCCHYFSPEILKWSYQQFNDLIYNDSYKEVDPDYLELRPESNAKSLILLFTDDNLNMFGESLSSIQHLDYGGGNGKLSDLLNAAGWNSKTFDPFSSSDSLEEIGKFNFISAFEVFEHVSDIDQLMFDLKSLLAKNGIVLFSTLLSDGKIQKNERLNWWYASPRNGHINLFSRKSLNLLAEKHDLNLFSFSNGIHMFFNTPPIWTLPFFHGTLKMDSLKVTDEDSAI
jgi:SAM-dependent methyltransferase